MRHLYRRYGWSGSLALLALLCTAVLVEAQSSYYGWPAGADPPGRAAGASATLSVALQQEFAAQAPGAQIGYWVILQDQADTRNDIPNTRWADKGWYVYNTLRAKADATQPAVLQQIAGLQQAGAVATFHSYWIVNSLTVVGDFRSAQALSSNPAVAQVIELPVGEAMDTPAPLSAPAQAILRQASLTAAQPHLNP